MRAREQQRWVDIQLCAARRSAIPLLVSVVVAAARKHHHLSAATAETSHPRLNACPHHKQQIAISGGRASSIPAPMWDAQETMRLSLMCCNTHFTTWANESETAKSHTQKSEMNFNLFFSLLQLTINAADARVLCRVALSHSLRTLFNAESWKCDYRSWRKADH